ncbi:phage late control D family protein [Epibacterium ulvae]|uniref:phage late control D family protein n=1 Tax=Epibacterium ulvae TaxID=1156985 RepID=UPI002493B604|nr:contractile injection system protein, VgrG/Pvc8 family [Epibacterium ulvae]
MKPLFQIIANGQDVSGNFQDRLISLTVIDEVGQKSDRVTLDIDDRAFAVALPETGAKLDIALGFLGNLINMGRYVVDDVSGELMPATMRIEAKAADMLGDIRARKTRAWEDLTLKQLVTQIAGEHGLKSTIGPNVAAHVIRYEAQTSESDLNFLTRIAKDLDAVAKVAGGELIVTQRGESELPVTHIYMSDLAGGSWQVTGRGRYGRVITEWTDWATGDVQTCTAGDKEPTLKVRHRYRTKEEAQRAAEARLKQGTRASGSIALDLGGFQADLTADARVNLIGVKPELEGEWHVTRVTHTLTGKLITRFEAERDNLNTKKKGS